MPPTRRRLGRSVVVTVRIEMMGPDGNHRQSRVYAIIHAMTRLEGVAGWLAMRRMAPFSVFGQSGRSPGSIWRLRPRRAPAAGLARTAGADRLLEGAGRQQAAMDPAPPRHRLFLSPRVATVCRNGAATSMIMNSSRRWKRNAISTNLS